MAYTAAQQAKIDQAQGRLNNAKAAYQGNVTSYSNWVISIQGCYKDTIPDASAASTWFNALNTAPCTTKGKDCKQSDVANCKAVIEKTLNASTIPNLKATYNEQVAAQANFDKVLSEVAQESASDPQNQAIHDAAVASANEAENTKQTSYWFWGAVVVVAGFLIFAYFKWFRKVVKVGV